MRLISGFLLTLVLGNGQALSAWFIPGIMIIVAGCVILPWKNFGEVQLNDYKNWCCFMALLAAIGIAAYTVADDKALRYLRDLPGRPMGPVEGTLLYMVLEGISCSIWQSLFVLLNRRERRLMPEVLESYKGAATITGIGIYLGWGMVLVSMNYVTNVSYVAAFRQLSIPLGALFGMAFLNEPRYRPKLIGIAAIFVGLVLVGLK